MSRLLLSTLSIAKRVGKIAKEGSDIAFKVGIIAKEGKELLQKGYQLLQKR